MARRSAMHRILENLKEERVILDAKIEVLEMAIATTRMRSRRVNLMVKPDPELQTTNAMLAAHRREHGVA